MIAVATGFRLPDDALRMAARRRPAVGSVMHQQWRDLLFLHWKFPVDLIQATLPSGLSVDTYDGEAYVGIVPFFMRNIRPRFFPAVPGISDFLEMNLRTYVHDRNGIPGVWFYSLDASQRLAVAVARRFFHLPYVYAEMTSHRVDGGAILYRVARRHGGASLLAGEFEYQAGAEMPTAAPGTLEFFLVERYCLYAHGAGQMWRGTVHHQPYPLCRAEVTRWSDELLGLNGFVSPGRDPDHVVMSRGVDVTVYPLGRVI